MCAENCLDYVVGDYVAFYDIYYGDGFPYFLPGKTSNIETAFKTNSVTEITQFLKKHLPAWINFFKICEINTTIKVLL